ncbi:hypothetical protein IGI37_003033 [Enterococcus sp. AZ194]
MKKNALVLFVGICILMGSGIAALADSGSGHYGGWIGIQ